MARDAAAPSTGPDTLVRAAAQAVAASRGARDFAFTRADFDQVRERIKRHAGISLAPNKEEMVYSRLARRLRVHGLTRFDDYLALLDAAGGEAEWEHFTNALTTNLTSFFRENHHFPVLARHLKALHRDRPLRVWSSASSTGEEPYSIAIAAAEAFGSDRPPVQILATDLDTRVLETARAAVYEEKRVAELGSERLKRFFLRGSGAHAGRVRVRPEIASLVRFAPLNLLADDWLAMKPFDAIFCRNVMIYFDKPTQYAVLRKLHRLLEPDGLFFAGHSESLFFAADLFRVRSQTVYERVNTTTAARAAPASTPHPAASAALAT